MNDFFNRNPFFNDLNRFFHHEKFNNDFPVKTLETQKEFIIEAELPGVKKENISLDIIGQNVAIRASKNDGNKKTLEQKVHVPYPILEEKICANYVNGLLKVTIPIKKRRLKIE